MGMIAQEVATVIPEMVFTNPVDGLKGINYAQTSALFVEAIKEQQQQIESQQKEIEELKMMMMEMKNEIASLSR
jgi:diacylglycerol kinase family enzyme